MTITIDYTTTIREVQERFNSEYPFLKIEFAHKQHALGQALLKPFWFRPDFKVLTIAKKPHAGSVRLEPWHRTGDIEQVLETEFGLHAQIFRQEKDKWVETAGTDVFTLDEQNEIGQKLLQGPNNWPVISHLF
jgi:hypothetical protein